MKNKKLAKEILCMAKKDQKMRRDFLARKGRWRDELDRMHIKKLKQIIQKSSWPTISLVGKKASQAAWQLVQHADHDPRFQMKVLQIMHKNKEDIALWNIAYLTDRILTSKGRPQIFGTQFKKLKNGKLKLFPIVYRKNLDARRNDYGLPPLETEFFKS